MKNIKLAILLIMSLGLSGCLGAMVIGSAALAGGTLAKVGWGSKPKMQYEISGRELVLHVSTYSANITSVKNMTDIGASILASEKMNCNYLGLNYAKWPNNLIKAAIKIKTTVSYECVSNPSAGAAKMAIVDVRKKLKYESDLVLKVRENNLLTPVGGVHRSINSVNEKNSSDKSLSSYQENQVIAVQKALKDRGYSIGSIDGKWGNRSRRELKRFQQDNGLQATGEFNRKTLKKLGL